VRYRITWLVCDLNPAFLQRLQLWDMRSKRSIQTLEAPVPVCAVAFSAAGDQVYSAGLDNNITAWELRKGAAGLTLQGHADTVTGLRVSPEGNHLLSNSMDNTLRVWDMRPYAPANRCVAVQLLLSCYVLRNVVCCTTHGACASAARRMALVRLLLACAISCCMACRQQAVCRYHGLPACLSKMDMK
jgi:hypothetical protein